MLSITYHGAALTAGGKRQKNSHPGEMAIEIWCYINQYKFHQMPTENAIWLRLSILKSSFSLVA